MNRLGVRVRGVAVLFLTVLPGVALADSNSVLLINATNGPIDAYTGTGVVIGQIETGRPDSNHVYLLNQILATTNLYNGTSGAGFGSGHATQVAGVMVSTNPATIGVAVGAKVYSVSGLLGPGDDLDFQTNVINAISFLASQPNLRVINMSIGLDSVIDTGTYGIGQPNTAVVVRTYNTSGTSVWERAMDNLVSTKSVSIVVAAGNEADLRSAGAHSVGGTNTVGEQAGAYNHIVVGSVTNAIAGTATNVTFFSGRGYLVNGRSAVDIVAPGEGILMPQTNGLPGGGGTNTKVNNGTSFAAPAVAGTIARLVQYGNTLLISNAATDPRTIKAVLLNSATKLPGWGQGAVFGGTPGLQGTLTGGVTQVRQPLDPSQGAGLLNAGAAFAQLSAGKKSPTIKQTGLVDILNPTVPLTGWDFNSVKLSLTNFYQLTEQSVGTLSITLDWYRDVGPTVAGTNSILGLANLTLNLYTSPDGAYTNVTLLAQSISSVDNLQHLWFTNAPAAYYQFAVIYNGYNSAGGSTPTLVDYGLAWSFAAIPEPSTLLLAALGSVVLLWRSRRRRS